MPDVPAPSTVEYCPDAHSPPHPVDKPDADEKLPASHDAQTAEEVAAPAVEYCPPLHRAHELDDAMPSPDP